MVRAAERYFCSVAAERRDEPMLGTASGVDRWLLVEQPGPWGVEAPPASALPGATLQALRRTAAAAGARLLLVRRPGGAESQRRHVFAVDSRPGRASVLVRAVDHHDHGLLGRLGFPDPGAPGAWRVRADPLLLVCTQGRHDVCCAVRGRPVAAALAALDRDATWECSHVGGDRFAANVVVLPAGLYLGRVGVADAAAVLAAARDGRVPRALLRGRAGLSPVVQAAQHFAAARLDADPPVDAFPPLSVDDLGGGRSRVLLAGADGPLAVTVAVSSHDEAALLTCRADTPRHAPVYELVDLAAG